MIEKETIYESDQYVVQEGAPDGTGFRRLLYQRKGEGAHFFMPLHERFSALDPALDAFFILKNMAGEDPSTNFKPNYETR